MVEPVVDGVAKPKRRWRSLIFLLIIILLVGVFTYWRHAGPSATTHVASAQAVGVAKVVAGPMPETVTALGTVTPTATVTVLPQLSGYLTDVAFTEGESVTKGQYLAQIDPRPYQVQLEQYTAQQAKDSATLAQAKSDLARYEILQKQDSISAQQVADQKFLVAQETATVQVDQAQIDTAKLDLTYCHIIAPVAGTVGLRLVDPGNYVTSGSSTGIAVITTISPITVIFSIPQTELAPVLTEMQSGANLVASAYTSDDATKIADGTLTAVDNQVNTSTGTVKLRATFANTNSILFPNEFVNIHLTVRTLQNVPLVPAQAVQSGAPGSYVYVVGADNTVSVQTITPGITDGINTVITKGLTPGQVVVTDGVDRLTNGMKVTIATPVAAPSTGAAPHKKHLPPAAAQ
ncbi:MAG TPA: efflux RND transporter periplasmic adaptor subunit [Acidocella sp.]|nr:MAG: efflux transporter periplasmic adaptor subunit [Acidocella sp. 20-58-15]HQT38870.1 efflux RND transporter periplasmic adaptor subunit [Acidocella sp.]